MSYTAAEHLQLSGRRERAWRRPGVRWLYPLWFLAVALAYLAPTLAHGSQLGDFEFLSIMGLTSAHGVPLHNLVSTDQIMEMVPWTYLNWVDVHTGHFPLWNQYAGLGLPQAFNLQSASFSLPDLISYLAPLHLSYTTTIVVKLVCAGSGAMFFARTLGVSRTSALMAGTIFELSGAFTGWLGWPQTAVFALLGWVLGALVLVARGGAPRRDIPLLAVSIAFLILGGHPESYDISAIICVIFVGIVALPRLRSAAGRRAIVGPSLRIAAGVAGGVALAAPLILPSTQVLAQSSHLTATGYTTLQFSDLINFAVATYQGLPILNHVYDNGNDYYESACYVGVVALALAGFALLACRRRSHVIALGTVTAVCAVLTFSGGLASVINSIPKLNLVDWRRSVMGSEMGLAVLAGIGLDTLRTRGHERATRRMFAGFALLAGVALAALMIKALVVLPDKSMELKHERISGLILPLLGAASCMLVAAALYWRPAARTVTVARRAVSYRTLAIATMAALEIVFLITATWHLWSSSSTGFYTNPQVRAYQRIVGNSRVGYGACPALQIATPLGILVEDNSAYRVSEFSAYDPDIPQSWYRAWGKAIGQPQLSAYNIICPSVATSGQAREFGVKYVLDPVGTAGPKGGKLVRVLGNEDLYRIPDSGLLTLNTAGTALTAGGRVVPYRWTTPNTVVAHVTAGRSSQLRIRISNLPGWQASVDGHAVPISTFAGAMMSIDVPAGKHEVTLTYDPGSWRLGLVLCVLTVLILLIYAAWDRVRSWVGIARRAVAR
ncbi:MAG TPA: YfhO family protein [Solirubrobacteraceae bacterium]|nr:YfhO family protein [Solirubrobacteraceae bacterium]